MGIILTPTITDGSTIDANDVMNITNPIVNELNGNLDNYNIADNAITQAKLIDNSVGTAELIDANVTLAKIASEEWTTFVPTSGSSFDIGNGDLLGSYAKIGRTVIARYHMVVNTTTVMGALVFGLPVQAAAWYAGSRFNTVGQCSFHDAGALYAPGMANIDQTVAHVTFAPINAGSTWAYHLNVSSTAPFTWGKGDTFGGQIIYEAA